MQSLLFCLSLLCNVQSGQSCRNSKLRKSRQAQVNVNTANSLLFFSLSLILFHGLLLKYRSTSSHKRKRSIFQHQEIKGTEWDNILQTWKYLKIPLLLFLEKSQWQGKIIFINSVRMSVGCKFCLTWKAAFSSWVSTSKIISGESKILCHT